MAGKASAIGLVQASRAPRISPSASARWRAPPTTSAASAIKARAAAGSPSTPSSPIPTMASQRLGGFIGCLRSACRHAARSDPGRHHRSLRAGPRAGRRYPVRSRSLSFAGRTRAPVLPPIAWRIGGFGGGAGLAAYLRAERIDALIDATHPFAARMSANACEAAIAGRRPAAAHQPAGMAAGRGRSMDRGCRHARPPRGRSAKRRAACC